MAGQIHGHGVDSEVPAAQVALQIAYEGDMIGMAVVGVAALGAEGGDLHPTASGEDCDRAVLQTCRPCARKDRHDLLRPCRGADVPVMRPLAQQHIPHAAAHETGGVTLRRQDGENARHIFRNFKAVHDRTAATAEEALARKTAAYYNLQHNELLCKQREMILSSFQQSRNRVCTRIIQAPLFRRNGVFLWLNLTIIFPPAGRGI